MSNPFQDVAALKHSAYYRVEGGELHGEKPVDSFAGRVHQAFRNFVGRPDFSCVAAKAALNTEVYRIGTYSKFGTDEATAGLARDLKTFVSEQEDIGSDFTTFVAVFEGPKGLSEEDFEAGLWTQLSKLNSLDSKHFKWDKRASPDPTDSHFAFSFAGNAFFIVGLHPGSSRLARRFAWPTLVFNAHHQFQKLREEGRWERLQKVIRERELALQGSLNPNLTNFGEDSEAKQYAGRDVGEDWQCPFQPRGEDDA